MRMILRFVAVSIVVLCTVASLVGAEKSAPIRSVTIGENAELRVNGQPFLPLMLWLQSDARIADGLAAGVNTFAGNGGRLSSRDYLDALGAAGLYGIVDFDQRSIGHPALLGWIHGDEPDLPRTVNDAQVAAGEGLRVNNSTPLERILDGVTHSWSVLDPLQGAAVTVRLKEPALIHRVSLWLTISGNLSVAKDVALLADGREILAATLKKEKGEQRFELSEPVRVGALTLQVRSTYPGEQVWGSIGEIAAYDAQEKNVLLSPPRNVPRATTEAVVEEYRKIKAADSTRPIFVTFTAQFMRVFDKYDEATKQRLYPAYVEGADVVGFDVYPIFGWAKPEWLHRVADGVTELRALAGPRRPIYAWIETNKGSRWVSPERQIEVRPEDTRAEVWMALIRGATAIGYFTHRWVPDYKQFAPEGPMVRELRRLNDQLTQLAPALLAPAAPVAITMNTGETPSHFKATVWDGQIYVFAQNIDLEQQGATARFSVAGLAAGTAIEVLDEGRTIVADRDSFRDTMAPLAEHVYRFPVESLQ